MQHSTAKCTVRFSRDSAVCVWGTILKKQRMPRGLVQGGPCSCMSKGNLPDEQPIAFTVRKTRFFGRVIVETCEGLDVVRGWLGCFGGKQTTIDGMK